MSISKSVCFPLYPVASQGDLINTQILPYIKAVVVEVSALGKLQREEDVAKKRDENKELKLLSILIYI